MMSYVTLRYSTFHKLCIEFDWLCGFCQCYIRHGYFTSTGVIMWLAGVSETTMNTRWKRHMIPPKIDSIAATKQSTTKSCVYFMVYTVLSLIAANILMVLSCYHIGKNICCSNVKKNDQIMSKFADDTTPELPWHLQNNCLIGLSK